MKKLSVIIANRNDTVMLCITIRSCIEELRLFRKGSAEIIVVDNSDQPIYDSLKSYLPTGYVTDGLLKIKRQDFPCLFSARETAIRESEGEYVVCLDSHMLVGRNSLIDLYAFMEFHKDDKTIGFAHAPISWTHQHERYACHDRDMSINELGDWNTAYPTERTITWKGMPWICKRDWFLNELDGYGVLAKNHISWGGGDMFIGIKPWLLGFKNWAVPTSPCIHIGPFPKNDYSEDGNQVKVSNGDGYRYRVYANSGKFPAAFGFLVSCFVLGGESMMLRNKEMISKRFGSNIDVDKWWERAKLIGLGDRNWLLNNQVISFEQLIETKPWE